MADSFKVELEGFDDLERKLRRMNQIVVENRLPALLAGGKVIAEEANARMPGADVQHEANGEEVRVGPSKPKWYYRFFEFGASEHPITPKKKSILAFMVDGIQVFARGVTHPGMQKQAFLKPAFNKKKDAAVDKARSVWWNAIKELVISDTD